MASRRGFSLTELMVVLAVILLLAALIFPAIGPARRQARMRQSAATVAEAMRLARSLAIAHSAAYSLSFETTAVPQEVRIYSGGGSPDEPDRIERLPEGIEFHPEPPVDGAVVFRPDGSCDGNYTVGLRNKLTTTDTRQVAVQAASGRVTVAGGAR